MNHLDFFMKHSGQLFWEVTMQKLWIIFQIRALLTN